MRRRRHRLEVSTFPFLAVLLCTMGSLILVLLVIDRRAKAGARAKALQAARQTLQEEEQARAARRAEWERRRLALHAALAAEVAQVRGQAEAIRHQAGDTEAAIRAATARFQELHRRLQTERTVLKQSEEALGTQREALQRRSKESEAAQAQLRRIAADLSALERVLLDLKAARARQQNSYSVIPYKGKYGDDRKPLYVECSGRGLVFHPDHDTVAGPQLTPLDIRAALERHLARHKLVHGRAGPPEEKPYLLMLLRPSGVENYYLTMGALVGLSVDFGYELVDEDWVFDFPDDGREPAAQPWMQPRIPLTVAPPPGQPRAAVPAGATGFGTPGIGAAPGQPGGWGGTSALPDGVPLARRGLVRGGSGPAFDPYRPPGYPGGPRALALGRGFGRPAGSGMGPGTGQTVSAQGPAGAVAPGGGAGTGQPTGAQALVGRTGPGGTPGTGQPIIAQAPVGASPGPFGSPTPGPGPRLGPAGPGAGGHPGTGFGPPGGVPASVGGMANDPAATTAGQSGLPRGPTADLGPPASAAGSPGMKGPTAGPTAPAGVVASDGPPGAAGRAGIPLAPVAVAQPGTGAGAAGAGPPCGTPGSPSVTAAGGNESGAPGGPADPLNRFRPPPLLAEKPTAPEPPPRPTRLVSSRDLVIPIECAAEAVVVPAGGSQRIPLSLLQRSEGVAALQQAVRLIIDRRQATLRPGEAPYRPQVRFLVRPDGLRAYYLAFPALEALQVPMTRANVGPDENEE